MYNIHVIKNMYVDGNPYGKGGVVIRYFYDYIRQEYYCDYMSSWSWPADEYDDKDKINFFGDIAYCCRNIKKISEEDLKLEGRKKLWRGLFPDESFKTYGRWMRKKLLWESIMFPENEGDWLLNMLTMNN